MRTFGVFSVIFWIFVTTHIASAQQKNANGTTPDEINKAMLKLINYYESYEDGSSASQQQAKFDKAFEEMTGGKASSKDYNDAFRIVDAYIKADRNPLVNTEAQQGSENDFIKKTDEYKQAEKSINQGFNNLMSMSYPDFEKTVLKLQPNKGRREIKETYNKMHKNDGKKVVITAADDELTKEQQTLWAIEAIENPKNYEEFVKAAKILDPKISEAKLKQGWEKYKAK